MIYCVVWKQDDKYKMFTNTIFQSEDKAIEFAESSM